MKKFIDIICKVKSHGFVEYLKYVGIFSFLIIGVYVFMLFAGIRLHICGILTKDADRDIRC